MARLRHSAVRNARVIVRSDVQSPTRIEVAVEQIADLHLTELRTTCRPLTHRLAIGMLGLTAFAPDEVAESAAAFRATAAREVTRPEEIKEGTPELARLP